MKTIITSREAGSVTPVPAAGTPAARRRSAVVAERLIAAALIAAGLAMMLGQTPQLVILLAAGLLAIVAAVVALRPLYQRTTHARRFRHNRLQERTGSTDELTAQLLGSTADPRVAAAAGREARR